MPKEFFLKKAGNLKLFRNKLLKKLLCVFIFMSLYEDSHISP